MDRVLGVMSIVIVGVAALRAWRQRQRANAVHARDARAGFARMSWSRPSRYSASAPRRSRQRLAGPVWRTQRRGASRRGMIDAVRRYSHHHRELVQRARACRLACRSSASSRHGASGRALGIDAGLAMYFIFIPIVLLIMLLPVTVSGLGTSQGAFGWLFGAIGVPVAAGRCALHPVRRARGRRQSPGRSSLRLRQPRGAADGVKIAAAALAGSVVVLSWLFGGGPCRACSIVVVYLLAVAPGLPDRLRTVRTKARRQPGCAARSSDTASPSSRSGR